MIDVKKSKVALFSVGRCNSDIVFSCQCNNLWIGSDCSECLDFGNDCEFDQEQCQQHFCNNQWYCRGKFNDFFCECNYGFIGNNCSSCAAEFFSTDCVDAQNCALLFCSNSLQCIEDPISPQCDQDIKIIPVVSIDDLKKIYQFNDLIFELLVDLVIPDDWDINSVFSGNIYGNNHTIKFNSQFLMSCNGSSFYDLKLVGRSQEFIHNMFNSYFYNTHISHELLFIQILENSTFEQCQFSGGFSLVNISRDLKIISCLINRIQSNNVFINNSQNLMVNASQFHISMNFKNNYVPVVNQFMSGLIYGSFIQCDYIDVNGNSSCFAYLLDDVIFSHNRVIFSIKNHPFDTNYSTGLAGIAHLMNNTYVTNSDFINDWMIALNSMGSCSFGGISNFISGKNNIIQISNVSMSFKFSLTGDIQSIVSVASLSNVVQTELQSENISIFLDSYSNIISRQLYIGGMFVNVSQGTQPFVLTNNSFVTGTISVSVPDDNIYNIYIAGVASELTFGDISRCQVNLAVVINTKAVVYGGLIAKKRTHFTSDKQKCFSSISFSSVSGFIRLELFNYSAFKNYVSAYIGDGGNVFISHCLVYASFQVSYQTDQVDEQPIRLGFIMGNAVESCTILNNLIAHNQIQVQQHSKSNACIGSIAGQVSGLFTIENNIIYVDKIEIQDINDKFQFPYIGGFIGYCVNIYSSMVRIANNFLKTLIIAQSSNKRVGLIAGGVESLTIQLYNNLIMISSKDTLNLGAIGNETKLSTIQANNTIVNCDLLNINHTLKYIKCGTTTEIQNPQFLFENNFDSNLWGFNTDLETAYPLLKDNFYVNETDVLFSGMQSQKLLTNFYFVDHIIYPQFQTFEFCRGICQGQFISPISLKCYEETQEYFCQQQLQQTVGVLQFQLHLLFVKSIQDKGISYCERDQMSDNTCSQVSSCVNGCGQGNCINNTCMCEPYYSDGLDGACSSYSCLTLLPSCYHIGQCIYPDQQTFAESCTCFDSQEYIDNISCVLGCPNLEHGHCTGEQQAICDEGYVSSLNLCDSCDNNYLNISGFCSKLSSCDLVTCLHGSCQIQQDKADCVCENLWTGSMCNLCSSYGENCSITQAQCNALHCQNQGQCYGYHDNFVCKCNTEYSGVNCQQCSSNFFMILYMCVSDMKCGESNCYSNGKCIGQYDTPKCECFGNYTSETECKTCQLGYFGQDCSEDGLLCGQEKCHGQGTCVGDKIENFSCQCQLFFDSKTFCEFCIPGYTGNHCNSCVDGYVNYSGVCIIEGCDSFDCGHGLCSFTSNNIIECSCDIGYIGSRCKLCAQNFFDIQSICYSAFDCGTQICSKHGICIGNVTNPSCQCSEQFGGNDCSNCLTGFYGTQCTLQQDQCDLLCGQNQYCAGGENYSCVCAIGTFTESCLNYSACGSLYCNGNGQCVGDLNVFSCLCQPHFNQQNNCSTCHTGYVGARCSQCDEGFVLVQDQCVQQDCSAINCNTGSCRMVDCIPTCICANHWSGVSCAECLGFGPSCNMTVIECASSQCKDKGTCEGAYDRFSCKCKESYEGAQCQSCATSFFIIESECVSVEICGIYSCNGKGSCVGLPSQPKCICLGNFSAVSNCSSCNGGSFGEDCLLDKDECGRIRCGGHGICYLNNSLLACLCDTAFQGENCNNKISNNAASVVACIVLTVIIVALCVAIVIIVIKQKSSKRDRVGGKTVLLGTKQSYVDDGLFKSGSGMSGTKVQNLGSKKSGPSWV